jgi:hypothetical protein
MSFSSHTDQNIVSLIYFLIRLLLLYKKEAVFRNFHIQKNYRRDELIIFLRGLSILQNLQHLLFL